MIVVMTVCVAVVVSAISFWFGIGTHVVLSVAVLASDGIVLDRLVVAELACGLIVPRWSCAGEYVGASHSSAEACDGSWWWVDADDLSVSLGDCAETVTVSSCGIGCRCTGNVVFGLT